MRARVGGRGGGQQRLLESDRNWQESAVSISNALLPARGAADLKATVPPLPPTPPKSGAGYFAKAGSLCIQDCDSMIDALCVSGL